MGNRVATRSKLVNQEFGMIEAVSAITGRSDLKSAMVGSLGFVVTLANAYVERQIKRDKDSTFDIFGRIAVIRNYVEPTADNDVLMLRSGLEATTKKIKSEYRGVNLIDVGIKAAGTITGSTTTQEKRSPFVHYIIDKMPEIDCFINNIGPISFTEKDLDCAVSIVIKSNSESFLAKIATSELLIATNLNPLTITEARMKKGMLLILSEAERLGTGAAFVESVVKPAVSRIKEGEKLVSEMVGIIQASDSMSKTYEHVLVSDEYISYGKQVKKTIPNKMEYVTGKILNIASKLEIGDRDTNRKAIAIFVEELRRQ
ncbi:MAG: hypothetical protein KGH61_04335 [Candidatus Micrarchaeota archaeon]|nr:hypothetical protein [Candidatus Micrarchaeota archaeon]MDE1848146.1 hypothetical protein [Candidatus Micrarchaeota archaeon]MDE1864106.1 hypothetical protein [Candidatus Micrarchaeota archaeon]